MQGDRNRYFRVADVEGLIPRLTEIFQQVLTELAVAREAGGELANQGRPPAEGAPIAIDPGAPEAIQRLQRIGVEALDRAQGLLDEVAEMGGEVKSTDGLVDFRSRHRGEEVYLCWRLGETSIRHWHDLTTGFRGRQPIADPEEFEGDWLQ